MKNVKRITMLMTAITLITFLSNFNPAVGSTLTVTSPNGGETWTAGTTSTITWTSDITGNVRISLYKNGVHRILITPGTPNNGTFTWMVPAFIASGTDYTVKISSCSNPPVSDFSNANFTINGAGGTIVAVTAPNGGETWTVGTMSTITWTSDIIGNVRIDLLKNGQQRAVISHNTPNDSSFTWMVPNNMTSGTDYTVKVSSCTNPSVSDVSDANFTINGAGGTFMTVTAPNGGETWSAGTTNTITWTSDITGNVRISLYKNGVHRAVITPGTPNSGTFNWLVPAFIASGSDYTVKISSCANSSVSDVSDANFTINGAGGTVVTVTTPNGGETWTTGTTSTITWTSDIIGNVRIDLLKNGQQRAVISHGTPNDSSFTWMVPACIASGTDYTVKISSCLNPSLSDVSDANFTINGGGGTVVTVTAPNGGETLTSGTASTITWTSDITGNVRISLYKNGVHRAVITPGTPNNGTFIWTIPACIATGTDYTVKISSCNNSSVNDFSDATFTINGGGGTIVTVTAPNGGESFTAGSPCSITWTSDITGNVRISLYKNGMHRAVIVPGVPNNGTYSWLIPALIDFDSTYTIKISSCSDPSIFDFSDATFSIVPSDGAILKTTPGAVDNATPTLSLYPNPAINILNVSADRNLKHVWLMNNLGTTVFESLPDSREMQINVKGFSEGIYFVRIETAGSMSTRKVIIK